MNKIKRVIALIIITTLMISNFTVAQAKSNDIKTKVVSVKNSKKSVKIKVKIINNSKKEITYGEDFSIYKKNSKGKWKIVKWNKGYGFGDVEHVLMAGYSTKKTFYVDKSAISKKMKKNTTYKIKFKISGKNKTIKFKIK